MAPNEERKLEAKVKAIHDKHSGIQSKRDLRDNILYGIMATLYLVLIVVGAVNGNWSMAFLVAATLLWVSVVWMQSKHINLLQFIVNVQRDLRDLETKEVLEVLSREDKPKKGKK